MYIFLLYYIDGTPKKPMQVGMIFNYMTAPLNFLEIALQA